MSDAESGRNPEDKRMPSPESLEALGEAMLRDGDERLNTDLEKGAKGDVEGYDRKKR